MKNIYLITILSLFIISCEKSSYKDKNSKSEYEQKVQEELLSDEKVNEIFLGFKFGDDKQTVKTKFNKLTNEGKLSLNKKNQYIYEFTFDESDLFGGYSTISIDYYNDKLYKLTLIVKKKENILPSNIILYQQLYLTYLRKYKNPVEMNNPLSPEYPIPYWINGNRQIKMLLGSEFVKISYTDLLVQKEIEEEKKNKTNKKIEQVKGDI